MTLDAELSAVRAVARQMRGSTRPMEPRRLTALATSLDHSARSIAHGVDFLRAEAEGQRPPVLEVGDPEPYRGLSVEQAARLLVQRSMARADSAGGECSAAEEARINQALAAEVDGFTAAVAASGRRTAPLARGVSQDHPGADGPGKARTGARETSRSAAVLAEPRSGTNRRAVLDAVLAVARDPRTVGLTDVEVQRATGLSPNSERPRRVELVDGGWLADSGRTREHYGREHTVWVVTDKAAALAGSLSAAV